MEPLGPKATARHDADARPSGTSAIERATRAAPALVGSTTSLVGLVVLIVVWLLLGPVLRFSSGWLLWPSAIASIVALLLVVVLQSTQNRDTRALQLKLDEVIRALGEARTDLLRLELASDEELEAIETELDRLRAGPDAGRQT